jgi:hypothetical protein
MSKKVYEEPLGRFGDFGKGFIELYVWSELNEDVDHYIKIPVMTDELREQFNNEIYDYFLRQGGYLARCRFCDKLFPFFQFGLFYGYCLNDDCQERARLRRIEIQSDKNMLKLYEEVYISQIDLSNKKEVNSEVVNDEAEIKKEFIKPIKKKSKKIRKNIPFGFVYLMKSDNGLHKIGMTSVIKNRLYGLNREIPVKVEVIHYFKSYCYREVERYLHKKYANERIRYEWFDLNEQQVEEIRSIKDLDLDKIALQ